VEEDGFRIEPLESKSLHFDFEDPSRITHRNEQLGSVSEGTIELHLEVLAEGKLVERLRVFSF